jgi:hypothetical protein
MKFFKFIFLVFSTSIVAQNQTVGVFQYNENTYEGYTLFSPSRNTYLIDNCGRLIHEWASNYRPGLSVYLLEDGSLLRTNKITDLNVFQGGGIGGGMEILDWEGNVIWSYSYNSTTFHQHHDVEPLPNGNILVLAWELKTAEEAILLGRDPNLLEDNELWPEHIIEIEPVGSNEANIVWEWHIWDHLIQDVDSTLSNYGVISDHPELLNINYTGPGQNSIGGKADWIHANSIDYNEELDQILITSRALSELWIIDHSTTTEEATGHTGGNSGMGGDIIYRWGNPIAYNRGVEEDRVLFGPHHAQWIDKNVPGSDNILIFNNGRNRPQGNYSTVDEILPPIDGFNYSIDSLNSFGPSDLLWTYIDSNPTDFFADHISGCQRLENGNTLICSGPNGRFFEVDEYGSIVWEYVNPVYGNLILNQFENPPQDSFTGDFTLSNSVFRCEKFSPDFIGFENYELTPSIPIEGPPYLFPLACEPVNLSEKYYDKELIRQTDLLGREKSIIQGFYINFYCDGSIEKLYIVQ